MGKGQGKIPIFDLTRQCRSMRKDLEAALGRVMDSGQFVLGSEVEALEQEVADLCGAKYAVAVASGTDALHLALRALGVGPGDEVIVPAFTFIATAEVAVYCGARPVFVDIEPETFNLDPQAVRAAVTSRTRAIIPVHLFGHPARMEEIQTLAESYGLAVVEDAAQAFGARYRGRPVGGLAHAGCFSFFPTKNLGAFGDGGMVVTSDESLAEKVRRLRVHGQPRRYHHQTVGFNSRLDALQAAVLRAKLPHVKSWNEARRDIAANYSQGLKGLSGLVCPTEEQDVYHVFHQYTLRAPGRRDELRHYLAEQGIGSAVYYPLPIPAQEAFGGQSYREGTFPEAERASREVLSLPMFPELEKEEIQRVIETVRTFWTGG